MRFAPIGAAFVALTLLACTRAPASDSDPSGRSPTEPNEVASDPGVAAAVVGSPAPAVLTADTKQYCPDGMALVSGNYCPEVRHKCLEYRDGVGRYAEFRCQRYEQPAECVGERVPLRFCMDVDEFTPFGESLPANFRSYTHAKELCGAQGKRVCREKEWNFACEGEELRPYPYGFERDSAVCNADQMDLVNSDGKLRDRRAPSNAYPRCVSPFGIRNLAGNLEEFVKRDDLLPEAPAMKGAYWQPGRNFCRAAQTAHDAHYNGVETGFRCCMDSAP